MVINYIKMTGPDLKRLYSISSMNGDLFAKRLGISRAGLYILFKEKVIPEAIEAKIAQDPEINKYRQFSTELSKNEKSMPNNGEINEGSDVVRFLTDTIQILKDVLVKGEKHSEMMQKVVDALMDNNEHVREEAELLRRMVMDGYDSGFLQWEKKDKKSDKNVIMEFYKDASDYQRSIKFLGKPEGGVTVCVVNAEGKVTYVNDEFTRQTGYSLSELKGKKVGPILQRDNTNQKSLIKIREAIKNRSYFEGEVINYSKSGDEIICRLTITPILDGKGNLEKLVSLAVFSKVNELA